jgi:hypothetical protein
MMGCASTQNKDLRNENIFNVNGKNIVISNDSLRELRNKWQGEAFIITSILMDKSDVQWIIDYISIYEKAVSKDCDILKGIQTRKFDINEPQLKRFDLKVGAFDYAWDIEVCGSIHTYRIVNEMGSDSFIVYPTKL